MLSAWEEALSSLLPPKCNFDYLSEISHNYAAQSGFSIGGLIGDLCTFTANSEAGLS